MEIFAYLDKKGGSGKTRKKHQALDIDSKALDEFEKDFNALDTEDLVNKYADIDKPLRQKEGEMTIHENETNESRSSRSSRPRGQLASNADDDNGVSHNDLQSLIDQQKSRVSSNYSK